MDEQKKQNDIQAGLTVESTADRQRMVTENSSPAENDKPGMQANLAEENREDGVLKENVNKGKVAEQELQKQENVKQAGMKNAEVTKEIISWVKAIVLAFIIAMVIRTFIFEPMRVPTGSMISTIQLQDTFFINKFIYRFTPIQRGDIAVFWFPDDPTVRFVKRVIGIGGDVIEIKGGQVFRNGEQLNEPYLNEPMRKEDTGPFVVPKDHYFMMGDNRNDSRDSRYWTNKYVSKDAIVGKLGIRIYPFNRFGIVK